ncbi:MAG: protein BatD [Desulfobacteraceae bacterium]|nr:protein BatD [Desulfobacteraceae bacterium]
MVRWITFTLISLALLCSAPSAVAEAVRAIVDRTHVSAGESIHLAVAIQGPDGDVDTSGIRDFKVLPRGSGTSIQIINGRTTRETRHNFMLIPLRNGRLSIPGLPVSIDGKTYHTAAIAVTVTAASDTPQDQREVFVQNEVSDENPYVGQAITYTFKLSQAVQITNARFQPPDFEGFEADEIEDQQSFRSIISGREYLTTKVTYVVVPLSAGEHTLGPAQLQCGIVRSNNRRRDPLGSIFDDSFFRPRNVETKLFNTEPLTLRVRPLPPAPDKVRFSGLVGNFEVSAQMDIARLKAGDSATLTVVVEGIGNIMDAQAPELILPDTFKIYDDNPAEDISITPAGYKGRKVFRSAVVPVMPGEFTIAPLTLTYFDPSKARYITRTTQAIDLMVAPSDRIDGVAAFTAPNFSLKSGKTKVEFTGRDILPIKTEIDAITTHHPLSAPAFSLWMVLPAILFGGFRMALRWGRKPADTREVMIKKSALSFKRAGKPHLSEADFVSGLYKALAYAIFAKAGTSGELLTYTEAGSLLETAGVSTETARTASQLLETIESAKYSGRPLNPEGRKQLLADVRRVVRRIS